MNKMGKYWFIFGLSNQIKNYFIFKGFKGFKGFLYIVNQVKSRN